MATRIPKELIKDLPNSENSGNSSSGNSGSGNSNVNFDLDKVIVREGILETGVYSFTTDKVANASDSYTELYLDGVKVDKIYICYSFPSSTYLVEKNGRRQLIERRDGSWQECDLPDFYENDVNLVDINERYFPRKRPKRRAPVIAH